jgi:hypothetical protein
LQSARRQQRLVNPDWCCDWSFLWSAPIEGRLFSVRHDEVLIL